MYIIFSELIHDIMIFYSTDMQVLIIHFLWLGGLPIEPLKNSAGRWQKIALRIKKKKHAHTTYLKFVSTF